MHEPKFHDWFVESGNIFIKIGASSRDIRLFAPVELTGTIELPIIYTFESTVGDLIESSKGRTFMQQMMSGDGDK